MSKSLLISPASPNVIIDPALGTIALALNDDSVKMLLKQMPGIAYNACVCVRVPPYIGHHQSSAFCASVQVRKNSARKSMHTKQAELE